MFNNLCTALRGALRGIEGIVNPDWGIFDCLIARLDGGSKGGMEN